MCGRYSLVTSSKKIHQQLSPQLDVPVDIPPNYNVAPTQESLVIASDNPSKVQWFRWGLVPSWAKDTKGASRLINARSEGIESKPSFRVPLRQRRCLVIADSFYEWQRDEAGEKVPYRIQRPNGELLLFAGLWDAWHNGERWLRTFTIITTTPNAEMAPIHNRMPVVLTTSSAQGRWLSTDLPLSEVLELLQPPADGILQMYPVSDAVNNVRNNGVELHEAKHER